MVVVNFPCRCDGREERELVLLFKLNVNLAVEESTGGGGYKTFPIMIFEHCSCVLATLSAIHWFDPRDSSDGQLLSINLRGGLFCSRYDQMEIDKRSLSLSLVR